MRTEAKMFWGDPYEVHAELQFWIHDNSPVIYQAIQSESVHEGKINLTLTIIHEEILQK